MNQAINCALILFGIAIWSCQGNPYQQGERLYNYYCANCHMEDGSGLKKLIPAVTDAKYLSQNRDQLSCIVKYGIKGPIVVNGISYNFEMEGFPELTDAEISNVINYMLSRWTPNERPLLPQNVSESLEKCNE